MKKIDNIEAYSRKRAIFSVCLCAATAALVFLGVSVRLLTGPSEYVVQIGLNTYRMFTVESNILVAACALLCIPYEIDGLRNNNFHMPRWIVYLLYAGVTAVSITFLVAVTLLSSVAGFGTIMLQDSNLYLHTLCPVFSILLFIFVASDHTVRPKATLVALIPVLMYAVVYIYMCFFLGVERGGWEDHYRFNVYLPWPITAVVLTAIAVGIATGLRLAHNKVHKKQKERYIEYYTGLPYPDIESAVVALAESAVKKDPGNNDFYVPRRVIQFMEKRYQSGKTMQELCSLYTQTYLKSR